MIEYLCKECYVHVGCRDKRIVEFTDGKVCPPSIGTLQCSCGHTLLQNEVKICESFAENAVGAFNDGINGFSVIWFGHEEGPCFMCGSRPTAVFDFSESSMSFLTREKRKIKLNQISG